MKNGEYLLSTEKVGKTFWKLAIPALITTLISQVYNLTDAYFIGMLNNTAMLSAVSMAMPIMWFVSALTGMIGAGAPQLISLKAGAGDAGSAARCRAFSVVGTCVMSLALTPVAYVLIGPALRLMNADGAILAHATEYLNIIILAGPITAVGNALRGVLGADGQAQKSSIAGTAGIIANIILDPIFILGFDMGMAGAAWATVLGSLVSLIFSIIYCRGMLNLRNILPSRSDISLMFKISLASTCSSIITSLTVGASFAMAAGFGGNTVASISVCSKIYSFVVSIVSALAFSMQPFIGYNYGAGAYKRLLSGLSVSLRYGTAVCIAGTVIFITCGRFLMGLFTDDPELISYGANVIRYLAIGLPVCALQQCAMSYLNGTGKAIRTLIVAMGRQVVVFVPLLLILQHFLADIGMMLAYPITDIITTVPAVLLCLGDLKKVWASSHAA